MARRKRELKPIDESKLSARLLTRLKSLRSRVGESSARRYLRKKTVAAGGRIFSARVSKKVKESSFIGRAKPASFQEIVKTWPDRVDERLQALLDDVTQQAFENVVNRTPVLTGDAALGWFTTTVNKYRRFIGNNQPHIRRLEHGWSKQPQRGAMVRSTLKRIPQMVTKAAARLAI